MMYSNLTSSEIYLLRLFKLTLSNEQLDFQWQVKQNRTAYIETEKKLDKILILNRDATLYLRCPSSVTVWGKLFSCYLR